MMNGPHGAVQSAASRTRLITAADGAHADPCSTSMPCNHEQQRTQMPLCISQSCCKHGRSPGFWSEPRTPPQQSDANTRT